MYQGAGLHRFLCYLFSLFSQPVPDCTVTRSTLLLPTTQLNMFTVHVTWSLDASSAFAMDIDGSDTIGRVKDKVARELKVDARNLTLHHEGDELSDVSAVVSGTLLVEGSMITARPSKRCEARMELASLGLSANTMS
eukprot:TRINITY_DN21061_c0_g1_i1.p1 TRINITY_DN21061_c0_g1~~TRINITY_DN21061_c0_g1_i1.p1  ORF type:complete len:137 (+),score=27.87 TRINITY_DN21061_c0_g1_i1:196-606(+)